MKTAALTLWFALATLLGPVACCCSLAAVAPAPPAKTPPADAPSAPRPAKSCCGKHHAAEPAAQPVSHHGQPAKPAKCPCESSGKRTVASLPPKTATAETAGHAAAFHAELPADPFPAGLYAASPLKVTPANPVYHLSGRNLLAAYSVLTC